MNRELKRRRTLTIVAVGVVVGALAFLAFGNIGTNLVYYWSPEELRDAGSEAMGASIRLGGLVKPGSIVRERDGLTLKFEVTDGVETVLVRSQSVPPAMFREGIGVVIEGTAREDGSFDSTRLMVKHDNEYRPPGDDDDRNMEDLVKTMQFEDSS